MIIIGILGHVMSYRIIVLVDNDRRCVAWLVLTWSWYGITR